MNQEIVLGPAKGRLGILTPGMGAVATTFIAGVIAVRKGLSTPIGSLTELSRLRLGKRTEGRSALIRELLPLTKLHDIAFGGWDVFPENAFQAAMRAKVIDKELLLAIQDELESIRPMPAVFDPSFVRLIDGPNKKSARSKRDLAEALRADIRDFRVREKCDRLVMIWCGSTETYSQISAEHLTVAAFERALLENSPKISPSMIYTYAAIMEGVPYANGAPNLSVELPALQILAKDRCVPIAGSDFKTGQTLLKTVLAPGFKARMLGVDGWYSTNILGNRDGEVLQDPESFRAKQVSKLGSLESILEPEKYPDLYGDMHHSVRIDYYKPRGDNKEGWDNIDLKGWLGYPMQVKVNFLCRDSILAAPLVLDIAQFLDVAKRAGMSGIQEWLSFFWKSPITIPGLLPEHDLFAQHLKLQNTIRFLAKEELINHLGLTYYGIDEEEASLRGNR